MNHSAQRPRSAAVGEGADEVRAEPAAHRLLQRVVSMLFGAGEPSPTLTLPLCHLCTRRLVSEQPLVTPAKGPPCCCEVVKFASCSLLATPNASELTVAHQA